MAGYILYLNFHWGGEEYLEAVNGTLQIVFYFVAFLVLLNTSRHPELTTRERRAWKLIALSFFSGIIANSLWGYFEVITQTQPFPSLADPFYLAYYPLMFCGLLMLAPSFQTFEERAKLALDTGIVTLGGGMLIWYFILEPLAKAGTENYLLTALSLAYPVSDLVLFFAITYLLFVLRSSGNRIALGFLLTGILLTFIADILFSYQNLNGTYKSGTIADSLYGLTCLAAALAGHYQYLIIESNIAPNVSLKEKSKSFSWLPYLAIAVGYGMLLLFTFGNLDSVLNQLIIIATGLMFLVVWRQMLSMREIKKAKSELSELHERFQGIYNASKDAIAFIDFDTKLVDVNDAYLSLTGYDKDELLRGTTYKELTPTEYHELNAEKLNQVIVLNQTTEYENEFLRKDGSLVAVSVVAFPVKGSEGKPIGIAAIIRDITESKRAEQEQKRLHAELEKQQQRLNGILDTVPCVIWEASLDPVNKKTNLNFVNDYVYKMYGYTAEELLSTPNFWFSTVHPDDRAEVIRNSKQLFDEGHIASQFRWINKDGRITWGESQMIVVKNKNGVPVGIRGVTTDISRRKEAERALRTSEEQHRLLFKANPQPAFVYDLKTLNFLAVNDAAVKHYGYSRDEFLNTITLKDIRPPEDIPILLEKVSQVTPEKDITLSPSRHKKKDGTVMDVEITSHMLVFNGKPAEIVLVNDVTERKKMEEKLRENEAQFRDLFDNAPIAYHELDSHGHFTRINKTEESLLGYTNEELKGRHPAEIIVEKISREAVEAKLAGKQKLEPAERTYIRKDGTLVSMLCTDYLIYDADGKVAGIRTTLQDITERKKLEQSLRASEESYRAFIEKSTEGIWRFDFDAPLSVDVSTEEQIDYALKHAYLAECNNAMAQMYGFDSAGDLLGVRLGDLLVAADETNSAYFMEFVRNNYRLNHAETHETNKQGESRYFLNNMVGIFEKGKIVSAWGTQRDVTERRKAEQKLKIFNEKLQQSNRELQDFAYVASHDLQEPLRKVQAFADRLGSKYADRLDLTGLDYLERMRNAAGRMQTLIQDLLSFSRVATKAQPFVPVNLEKITREVLSDLEVKIEETGAGVEIDRLPELDADPSHMRQLMQNLIGNALKFHRQDVAPAIKISAEPCGNRSNGSGAKGNFCQITVSDNGIGFDEKYLDKIFTVFQRLHGRTEYEGSGIGLAVCRKIVERHGGTLTARSAPGEGASFIITLPFKQSKIEVINNES